MLEKIIEIDFAEGITNKDKKEVLNTLKKAGYTLVNDKDYVHESKYYVCKDYDE